MKKNSSGNLRQAVMGIPLRVLILEDSEDDAMLVLKELQRAGYRPVFERAETPDTMLAALRSQK